MGDDAWVSVQSTVPRLRTQRLLLREWRDADRGPFAALNADPEVMALFPAQLTRAESDALVDRMIAGWAADGFGLLAVERTGDGAFLGFTGLGVPAWAPLAAPEIGWRLARFAWGHGYATEAARAALRFGFTALDLPEIVSYTTVANRRSRRVMERIGMTHDPAADFDHPRLPDGHPLRPHVTYRLARQTWRRLQAMDKTILLDDIRRAHAALEAAVAALDDDALMAAAPDMPGWTRKDVLAHVEWWTGHSAGIVEALLEGREPYPTDDSPFDIDIHNAKLLAESRARSIEDVRDGEAAAYRRVVAAVERASEADLAEPGRFPWLGSEALSQTVAADTSSHYAEHLPHLSPG